MYFWAQLNYNVYTCMFENDVLFLRINFYFLVLWIFFSNKLVKSHKLLWWHLTDLVLRKNFHNITTVCDLGFENKLWKKLGGWLSNVIVLIIARILIKFSRKCFAGKRQEIEWKFSNKISKDLMAWISCILRFLKIQLTH